MVSYYLKRRRLKVRGWTSVCITQPATNIKKEESVTQNDEEKPQTIIEASAHRDQQTFHFADGDPGFAVDFEKSQTSGYDRSKLPEAALGEFLARPVRIATKTWVEGTQLRFTLDPWSLFFTDPAIKRKIDNYALLRCNLRVKVVISASPFYYGLGMVSYNPLPDYHPSPSVIIASTEQLVTYSQRPKFFICPQSSSGGEMSLPFFYDRNWLQNNPNRFPDMGTLDFDSFSELRTANSDAGGDVTINVYAWAENMEMSGPTATVQARKSKVGYRKKTKSTKSKITDKLAEFGGNADEYGDGPVSGIASAVAAAGNALSSVPIIGPFARATEIGAGTVSRIAAWFGFTNVPVIKDVDPFKDLPFGGFASSEISAPTPKLTLDPKNELTLDSRTVGLDGTDELSLSSFVTRESYLTSFEWTSTDSAGAPLWTSLVSPGNLFRKTGVNTNLIWPTPLSHACTMYQNWSGSVVFRFKIVSSQYHRGRIKIAFEPDAGSDWTVSDPGDTTNVTRMYDISTDTDVEICVPWMQAVAYLANYEPGDSGSTNTVCYGDGVGSSITGITAANGWIRVSVANELSAPVTTAPVSVVVFVRAGEDFELMGPRNPPRTLAWNVQSKTMKPEEGEICDLLGEVNADVSETNLVYGGETAVSLRQLLHRHCFVYTLADSTNEEGSTVPTMNMYPLSYNPQDSNKNIHGVPTGSYNYVSNSFVSWLSPCFAGRRGSMYWASSVVNEEKVSAQLSYTRDTREALTDFIPSSYTNTEDPQVFTGAGFSRLALEAPGYKPSGNGSALYSIQTQSGATVLVPFISRNRLVGTHPSPFQSSTAGRFYTRGQQFTMSYTSLGASRSTMDMYCAAGPDFNLFFFAGIPTLIAVEMPPIF